MRSRFPTSAAGLLCVLLLGTSLVLWSCGPEPASTTTEPVPVPGTTASTAAHPALSFEETWAASLAALEALGLTRVGIVETTEGLATKGEIPPKQSNFGPQTQKAEQLFDVAGGRARLTVHTSDRGVKTTVVQGKEQTSSTSQPLTNSALVSVSRYIALQAPEGLPLPLWAGNAVGPTQGYPDLFQGSDSGDSSIPSDGTVAQQEDGGTKLSWERATNGVTSAMSVLLDSDQHFLSWQDSG